MNAPCHRPQGHCHDLDHESRRNGDPDRHRSAVLHQSSCDPPANRDRRLRHSGLPGGLRALCPFGQAVLATVSDAVSQVVLYANDGIDFLFGGLANVEETGFVFAIKVLPVIIFFSSLTAVLYYLGIMQWIIRLLGGALQKALGTSRTESLSATANIFVGQTEAPLVVRPFINRMTQSQLFAVMCGGLASVAGSVLAGYAAWAFPWSTWSPPPSWPPPVVCCSPS